MDFLSTHNSRDMYSRAAWTIGFAVVLYFINRAEYPGPAATLLVVITLIGIAFAGIGYGLNWLSTEGQRRVREQILDTLQLQGSERILSLSHELGLDAAKRLKSGKVISLGDTTANEAAREAAKLAGLGDKIRFEASDAGIKLSYPDSNFDAVIASGALQGLKPSAVVDELLRVLKPGAQLVLHQPGDLARDPKLSSATLTPTSVPLGLGGIILAARK